MDLTTSSEARWWIRPQGTKAFESFPQDLAIEKDLQCVANLFFHQVGQIWSCTALVKAFESSPRGLAIEKGLKCVANLFFHQVGQIWSYKSLVKAFESSP